MFFLVFTHVNADHGLLVVEQKQGQGLGQFGFADPGGAHEQKGTDRTVFVLQSGAVASHGFGHGLHGGILTDDPTVQFIFEVQEFGFFAFQHALNRDAGPTGHYLSNILVFNDFPE